MVIVMTTRREGVNYLPAMLATLGDVGGRRKLIYSDGPHAEGFRTPDGWSSVESRWAGARRAGWNCLRLAHELDVESLILLQDDITVCQGGGAVMDETPVPADCIALTFYTPYPLYGFQPSDPGRARVMVAPAQGTAQALKFSRAALDFLCSIDPLAEAAKQNISPLEPHLFDDSLFAIARSKESPLRMVGHVMPNPVGHVGKVSACGTHRKFEPQWYVRVNERFPGVPSSLPVERNL